MRRNYPPGTEISSDFHDFRDMWLSVLLLFKLNGVLEDVFLETI